MRFVNRTALCRYPSHDTNRNSRTAFGLGRRPSGIAGPPPPAIRAPGEDANQGRGAVAGNNRSRPRTRFSPECCRVARQVPEMKREACRAALDGPAILGRARNPRRTTRPAAAPAFNPVRTPICSLSRPGTARAQSAASPRGLLQETPVHFGDNQFLRCRRIRRPCTACRDASRTRRPPGMSAADSP